MNRLDLTAAGDMKAPMKIAQVGAYKRPSSGDSHRMACATEFIIKRGIRGKPNHDTINLEYGRDFLGEQQTYDVVIIHSIFDPDPSDIKKYRRQRHVLNHVGVSPKHSHDEWRRRLAATGAKLIVVFEGLPMCLHGWALGEIPGYRIIHRDAVVTTYAAVLSQKVRHGTKGEPKHGTH